MASMGKIATEAAARIKKQAAHYAKNRGEMANFGPMTRAKLIDAGVGTNVVTRSDAPRTQPRGHDLGNDSKNVKIRQGYEAIPEARVTRPAGPKRRR